MKSLTKYQDIKRVLSETKTIAVVGVSNNPVRASYFVARYLHYRRFDIIPINPAYAGKEMFGKKILASVSDIPKNVQVDMVDIFRRAEFVPEIVDEAITHLIPGLKTIWMQFGIRHEEAASIARQAGLQTVEDRCPKIEYQRLFGELRKAGINTGIISSKLPEWKL
ncbi:MAG: CoA-binding protein [Pseudomonadota bacterium]